MRKLLFGAVIAAAARWFLHPEQGNQRREQIRDKTMGFGRKAKEGAAGKVSQVTGKTAQSDPGQSGPTTVPEAVRESGEFDDSTLQAKVESEIFRDPEAPKGRVSVNAESGVVYLRGELDSREQIEALADAAGRVDGVRGVENLLHTPGEPAPTKDESHHTSGTSA
jgi:osmotically-inducible protein OsmY